MIRAPLGNADYWDDQVHFFSEAIDKKWLLLKGRSVNPQYDPQYCFDLSKYIGAFIFRRYSRGDPIQELTSHIHGLLDAWELSNNLARDLNVQLAPGQGWDHRHLGTAPQVSSDPRAHNDPRDWVFDLRNLNHYNWCFWLVGLALSLELPNDQRQRLLSLVGGEGQDVLLDRVIASRQPERQIGSVLLHPKPYGRLLKAIDAPEAQQAKLLRDFVDHWYVELARKGDQELWWYIFGDPQKHPLSMGSYFGRWCIEAVAAVKAFGLDDSLCLGDEHYPGDLLRPDGPTTHPQRSDEAEPKKHWLRRWLGG